MDRLVTYLPFAVDDFASVNDCFAEYVEVGDEAVLKTLDIWTYCFVRRYMVRKCLNDSSSSAADLEGTIDAAFIKIRANRGKVSTGRYANWVSVVCRNTYLNYVRSRRPHLSLDEPHSPDITADGPIGSVRAQADHSATATIDGRSGSFADPGFVAEPETVLEWDSHKARQAVESAISRLPQYLQEIATLRLVEGLSYEHLAETVARPVPVLRSYVHRIILRLRKDERLIRFFFDDG